MANAALMFARVVGCPPPIHKRRTPNVVFQHLDMAPLQCRIIARIIDNDLVLMILSTGLAFQSYEEVVVGKNLKQRRCILPSEQGMPMAELN